MRDILQDLDFRLRGPIVLFVFHTPLYIFLLSLFVMLVFNWALVFSF